MTIFQMLNAVCAKILIFALHRLCIANILNAKINCKETFFKPYKYQDGSNRPMACLIQLCYMNRNIRFPDKFFYDFVVINIDYTISNYL